MGGVQPAPRVSGVVKPELAIYVLSGFGAHRQTGNRCTMQTLFGCTRERGNADNWLQPAKHFSRYRPFSGI